MIEEFSKNSGTTTGCLNTLKLFLKGTGFEDDSLDKIIVNKDGLKIKSLKKYTIESFAMFNSFSWHIQYNMNYQIAGIKFIPFPFCRFKFTPENNNGTPIDTIIIYDDWAKHKRGSIDRKKFIELPFFNPNPIAIKKQVEQCEGKTEIEKFQNYKGQILYFTGLPQGEYPLCRFDSVLEDTDTDSQLKVFRNKSVRNKFTASAIISKTGVYESDDERQKDLNKMADFQGADDGQNVMFEEVENPEFATKITPFPIQNTDALYKSTTETTKFSITECFTIPPPLPPHQPIPGKLGLSHDMFDACMVYNSFTQDDRDIISDAFAEVFQYFKTPIKSDFKILPIQLITLDSLNKEAAVPPEPAA